MPRKQVLKLGKIERRKQDEDEVLYFLAGRKLYVVGAQSGDYPMLGWRRPGVVVGKRIEEMGPEERPVRAAHLLNEMGGVWAQPIKVLDGFYYSIRENGVAEPWQLRESCSFCYQFTHGCFSFGRDGLAVERLDFVAESEPALFSTLTIANRRSTPVELDLELLAHINILPAWFAGWSNGDDESSFEEPFVTAYDSRWPNRWAVTFGTTHTPRSFRHETAGGKLLVTLTYHFDLAPRQQLEAPFLFVADNTAGMAGAQRRYRRLLGRHQHLLRRKVASFGRSVFDGLRFDCSDPEFVSDFYIAKANLDLLLADLSPHLGRYFFGGVPEYVQLFGTDTCYSVPGLVGSGLASPARDALRLLLGYGRGLCGRIPHEVTTNGRVFHPGNPQEIPQFAIACWNYFRWTGDRQFLAEVYPVCEEGLLDYLVAHWDADLDFYPDGQSMVERRGADGENLDSVCYFCRALFCLAEMATTLGFPEAAIRYRDQLAGVLRVSINNDFWMESQSLFADSLLATHSPNLDGYWTVVVPLETSVADDDKAERALDTIMRQPGWLNEYGLVHTRGREDLVWTLPTGLLAKVALAHGEADLGVRLLSSIASTTRRGTLGAFQELIPEGLSFIQLWSPAIYLQGIVEGIFGLSPQVHRDAVELFPSFPSGWSSASLRGIRIGEREIEARWVRGQEERLRIRQVRGSRLDYTVRRFVVPAGGLASGLTIAGGGIRVQSGKETKGSKHVLRVDFSLEPGQEIEIAFAPPLEQTSIRLVC